MILLQPNRPAPPRILTDAGFLRWDYVAGRLTAFPNATRYTLLAQFNYANILRLQSKHCMQGAGKLHLTSCMIYY
jgi:hypothetical protein